MWVPTVARGCTGEVRPERVPLQGGGTCCLSCSWEMFTLMVGSDNT